MSVTTDTAVLAPGTWVIDREHSEVSAVVRHLMVSKVRSTFRRFEGAITVADDPLESRVEVTIDAASIDTDNADRDAHIRSADFLDVEQYPTIDFRSSKVVQHGDDYVVTGDLTVHGVTKPVDLALEFNGWGPDPYGGTRAGFSASTSFSRKDFGVDIDLPLDGGGAVVGDQITVQLEVEAILADDPS
jgi:polyisoprenoid-binding protein YceI